MLVGWLDFYTDANTCNNEAQRFTAIATTAQCLLSKLWVYSDAWYRFRSAANCFKYGAKVIGHESCLWSEGSTGAKVPWNESSWTFRSSGANVPWNESSTGAKVLSMVFSLPWTKVQRNEKASYPLSHSNKKYQIDVNRTKSEIPIIIPGHFARSYTIVHV